LKIHTNDLAILVDGSPQVMLLAIDFYEDLIDEKGVAIASVLSFQAACIDCSELDTPEPDRFAANCNAALCENIFDEWPAPRRWLKFKR
jgi:hypothetical protein